jgi:HEPN domain-containing protein
MKADPLTASLLRIAAEDLAGARLLAAADNRNAVYLLEQAAEKVIRAVLTHAGTHAGITHHLDEMVDKLADDNPFKDALRSVEHLGAYATSYRYPTSAGRVKEPPAREAFAADEAAVAAALRSVAAAFGVPL